MKRTVSSKCPTYVDDDHCFVAGYIRRVTRDSTVTFEIDASAHCADDDYWCPAKQCACGETVLAYSPGDARIAREDILYGAAVARALKAPRKTQ